MRSRVIGFAAATGILHPTNFFVDKFDCSSTTKWDSDWDRRSPVDVLKWNDQSTPQAFEDYNEKLKSLKGKANRHIILVRHGQYEMHGKSDTEKRLTALGRRQAAETGRRLKLMARNFQPIVTSTLQRAMETTSFILDSVSVAHSHDSLLEEGFPYMTEPLSTRHVHMKSQCLKDGSRIEAAFRRYFWRPGADQVEDSYEIFVCHANVIRYMVCRALQLPPEAWLRMSLPHASITWISVRPNGSVSLRCLGESGHLPVDIVTR